MSLSARFVSRFGAFTNDPDTKVMVIHILEELLIESRQLCKKYESDIDTMDKYGGRLCIGTAAGGIGAILLGTIAIGSTLAVGPLLLTLGSGVGLAAFAKGRSVLSRRKRELESNIERLERLVARLTKVLESQDAS